jgi:hypothetical protein
MWVRRPSFSAAIASMRPSWPAPRMPIVAPGLRIIAPPLVGRKFGDLGRARRPPRLEPRRQRFVGERQHGCGEQRRVDRARFADRERADRNAGRHLHDGEETVLPFSAFEGTGTPNTGSVVKAAVMPGRCAAPPAPAMMTLKPAAFAPLAKATMRSGVRWAETIRAS